MKIPFKDLVKYLVLFPVFFLNSAGYSQEVLQVDNNLTPQELVDILIGGGVETSNITYTGAPIARGKFWGGPGNIGIGEGVILTSGSVNIAPGPNSSGSAGNNNNAAGDPDLQAISGVSSHNACILEFDFVPQSSLVSFRYVFASEEYHEFAGSSVNDAFGFFISGPGINGPFSNNSTNIALIPFTNIPVSINTVNNGTSNTGPCENCQHFVHNSQNFTQYDAFTKVLKAFAYVTPCSTYHIKLAIGDGGDGVYDSGVFLEANSFNSVSVQNLVEFDHAEYDFAIEGCNSSEILFELTDAPEEDYWMPLIISGSAINGVDYVEISDSLFFPAGYKQAFVDLIPIDDNQTEWPENVLLIYNASLCGVNYDTVNIPLRDYKELFINTSGDTTINCNTGATISIEGLGGYGPYDIIWSTGDTTESITVSPLITTTYYVTVSALCDSVATGSVTVYVDGPEANAGPDKSIPYGTTTALSGSASQGSGVYGFSWEPSYLLDNPSSPAPVTVNLELTTVFTLTVTDQAGGCLDTDEVVVSVTGGPLGVNPTASPSEVCFGLGTQLISYASGGSEDYSYLWSSDPPGFNSDLVQPFVYPQETTTYFLTVNDGFNNVSGQVTVTVLPLPDPDAGSDKTIPHGTNTTLLGSGSGGSGSYLYIWEPSEKLVNPYAPNPYTVKLYETTLFRLSVIDEETGCASSYEDLVTVNIEGGPLTVVAESESYVVCDGDGTRLFALGSGGNFPEYEYQWSSFPAGFTSNIPDPFVNPEQSTDFIVEIFDGFNYDHDTIRVEVSSLPAVNLGADIIACPYDSVTLSVNLPGLNYYWSNGDTANSIKVGSTGIGYDLKTFSVDVWDELGCLGTDEITVAFDFSRCFGIAENPDTLVAEVFPNPNNGYFTLRFEAEKGPVEMEIYNLFGQVVYDDQRDITSPGTFETTIALRDPVPGVYIARIVHQNKVFIGRVLID